MATDQSKFRDVQAAVAASLHLHWRAFLIEGIVLLVLGIFAILIPNVATIAVEVFIGWVLLLSGVVGFISTFRMRGAPGFGWSLLSAVIAIAAGVILLVWPLSGALSLTLILTAFLTIEGIASFMMALSHRHGFSARWALLLVSGVIDLILAAMIFLGLPGTAAWAIGLLVGINMVFGGSTLISMALQARSLAPTSGPRTS
ncbi:MAG: HdeD family acid-resistance protein [Steroidobacteraceae bacterium]